MQIQVLGTGCATCKNLFEITQRAAQELGIADTVEYITDINKLIELGVMTSPILAVNGKAVMAGFSSDVERIKQLLLDGQDG